MKKKPSFFQRLAQIFAGHQQGYEPEDEALETYGTIVEVTDTVGPDHNDGRIALQGSTWKATSLEEVLPPGSKAKVIFRENIVWVVERYDGDLSPGQKIDLTQP